MRNIYALQYRILIFSLVIYNLAYCVFEFPYILKMYSIYDGYNTLGNLVDGFYEIHRFIVSSPLNLKAIYLMRAFFALGLLCKPLRKISLLGLVLHSTIFESLGSQHTPEVAFLNILYLFLIAVPEKKFQLFKSDKNTFWMYPLKQQKLLWVVTALAYSVSGLFKLMTPSWQSGAFMSHFLIHHLSRFDFSSLVTIPFIQAALVLLTYMALATELLALPMVFNRYTRLISFILITGMQIVILILADVSQISLAMLVFNIYLFEPKWLRFFLKCNLKKSGTNSLIPH